MDFRIKYVLGGVLLLATMNCKSHKTQQHGFSLEEYVLSYKNAVLYGCIDEKTDKEFSELMNKYKNTASREVAILSHGTFERAESVGKEYSKQIKPHTYYEDLKGLEFIFSDCVIYAFSKEVDAMARESYKKYVK